MINESRADAMDMEQRQLKKEGVGERRVPLSSFHIVTAFVSTLLHQQCLAVFVGVGASVYTVCMNIYWHACVAVCHLQYMHVFVLQCKRHKI